MGSDQQPWTSDDRPLPDLRALTTRGGLDTRELGALLAAARAHRPLPRDPGRWVFVEGLVLTRGEARHLTASVNACPVEELHDVVRLTKRARQSLSTRRPFHDLTEIAEAPGLSRGVLSRLLHHAPRLSCATPPPPLGDHVELALEAHPTARHLIWIIAPERVDALMEQLRRAPDLNKALNRDLGPLVLNLARARPPDDDERTLRVAAAEQIALQWTAQRRTLGRWGELARDLGALRRLEPGWEVFERRGVWIARGWCLGERVEVRYRLGSGEALVVETPGKTNPPWPNRPGGV
ncbi:MAG: hypothetical protein CMH57_14030 [Myxococcales bacterium]|nr:hypothetical protein [Myxococcales bacterium]